MDTLFALARQVAGDILSQKSKGAASEAAAKMIALAEDVIGQFEHRHGLEDPVACGPGCAYCCHYQVVMTAPEVFLVGRHVRQHFTATKTQALFRRIDRYLALRDGKDVFEVARVLHDTPCVFLKDDRCAVYPVRPLVCRAWHAMDRDACRTDFESAVPDPEVEGYTHRHYVYKTVARGLEAAVKEIGCQAGAYGMAGAMKTYFSHPAPETAWINGEPVFDGGPIAFCALPLEVT
ncbi:MAG: YkgJ family cysteine cluster protein [Deltaproteobacteria bacterium]|nr:YkgJ family cysteine cluster protein [Deltaproteobacteria bacterium]